MAERPTVRARLGRLGRDSAYVLGGFPLAVMFSTVVIAMLATSAGLVVVWFGIPLLAFTLLTARGFATVERRFARETTGRAMPAPRYRSAPAGSAWQRLTYPIRDPQLWLDALWAVVHVVVSAVTFSLAVSWWAAALWTVAGPVLEAVIPASGGTVGGPATLLGIRGWLPAALLDVVVGGVFALTLPWAIRGLASFQSLISHALLCMRGSYEQRIDELQSSRSAVQKAEADSLRRLERDIHDGPQQRLIRLQMDLARAERLADSDPERARLLVADARTQTQETLAELRQLSRGIAPPVLVDRGLDAAIDEVAARSEVPVTVLSHVPDIPDHIATAAYFVIAECLANINKHSGATEATVTASVEGETLVVTVSDDGQGGASVAKGHGLHGLAERLRGVDGTLEVTSPAGGPTVVQAVVPCGS